MKLATVNKDYPLFNSSQSRHEKLKYFPCPSNKLQNKKLLLGGGGGGGGASNIRGSVTSLRKPGSISIFKNIWSIAFSNDYLRFKNDINMDTILI